MTGEWELDVREYPKEQQRTDYKDFFRVYVAPGIAKSLGLEKGDPCSLQISGKFVGIVLIWEANRGIKARDIQIPKQIQSLYGIDCRTKASLSKIDPQLPAAKYVELCEVASAESRNPLPELCREDYSHWAWELEEELYRAETVSPGMVLENVLGKRQRRSFKIQNVNGSRNVSPHRYQPNCEVRVVSDEVQLVSDEIQFRGRNLVIPREGLDGLETQIKQLNEEITTYANDRITQRLSPKFPKWKNGIILYGASNTGKSPLLRKIGEAGWRGVFTVDDELLRNLRAGEKTAAMRKVFADARKFQPSVILIDDLDQLASIVESQPSGQPTVISRTLRQEIEGLGDFRTLVVATTCSLTDIDQKLRSIYGFSIAIEVPVPDSSSRASILKTLSGLAVHQDNALLDSLATRTHGFVWADLALLLDAAARKATARIKDLRLDNSTDPNLSKTSIEQIMDDDIDFALRKVQPTAIRKVFVETPKTVWRDIGGQEEVKNVLDRALNPHWMKTFDLTPRKGLLLYGPPGCSKTMIARAAATESGYSFIAVKGAELLNMYVGESERKIREYFRLARSVSPSILFLDEIDAIGTARDVGQHSGLHVVTTLLNELDGIEELKDVFVLAATNKPDVIDPALTRAGRLDTMLYVGPPDVDARRQILEQRLQKVPVAEDLNISALAEATERYSGAELMNICRGAAEAASDDSMVTDELVEVGHRHFGKAMEKVEKVITPSMLAFFEDFRARRRS